MIEPAKQALLTESQALLEGHFLLTSGRHSARYFQAMRLLERPDWASQIAQAVASEFQGAGVTCTFAPALGGIVWGYELARQFHGARALFAERVDGVMRLRRGFSLTADDVVLLAEDVITTGGSILELKQLAEEAGARVAGVGCVLERSEGAFQPGVPVSAWLRLALPTWDAEECALCRAGSVPIKPGSRGS